MPTQPTDAELRPAPLSTVPPPLPGPASPPQQPAVTQTTTQTAQVADPLAETAVIEVVPAADPLTQTAVITTAPPDHPPPDHPPLEHPPQQAAPRVRGSATASPLRRMGAIYLSRVSRRGEGPVTVLVVYVVLLMLVPARNVLPGVGATGTIANLFILAGLVWYGSSWLVRRVRPTPGTRLPRLAMLYFAVAVLLSYVAAARRDSEVDELSAADRGLVQLLAWFPLVLIAVSIKEYEHLDRVLRVFVRCAAVVACVAILEFVFKTSLTAWMTIPGFAHGGPTLATRGQFVRPTATATNTLEIAAVMTIALPFALQQAFHPVKPGLVRQWLPVILIAMSALMSVSRTSVIGIGIVLLVLVPTWPRRRLVPALVAIVFALAATRVVLPGLGGTLIGLFSAWLSGGDNSTNSREATSDAVAGYLDERPWTGRGFGTFLPLLYRYTDNEYLLARIEMGIVGMLAVAFLYIVCLHCGGAGRRQLTDTARRETGQGFVAVGCVMLVVTATFDTLSFPMVAGMSFLLMGLAGAYLGMARQELLMRKGEPSL